MVTRQLFQGITITDSIYSPSVEPFVMITKIHFHKDGIEIGYATLSQSGALYCNEAYLAFAVEWLVNMKHFNWYWKGPREQVTFQRKNNAY